MEYYNYKFKFTSKQGLSEEDMESIFDKLDELTETYLEIEEDEFGHTWWESGEIKEMDPEDLVDWTETFPDVLFTMLVEPVGFETGKLYYLKNGEREEGQVKITVNYSPSKKFTL